MSGAKEEKEKVEVEEEKEEVEEEKEEVAGSGAKVNVFVYGSINTFPFELFAENIKEESGIELNLASISEGNMYTKLKDEFVNGTGAFDLVVIRPAWIPEFISLKAIRPMNEFTEILDPKLDDIIPPFLKLYCMYDGKLYCLPYDGDVHVYYYRKDLVEDTVEQKHFKSKYGYELAVPETWKKAIDFAEFFTRKKGDTLAGKVLKQDFYGNGMLLGEGWSHYEWMNHFVAYNGIYFNEDFKPMINSEAGINALEDLERLKLYAPPEILSWGYRENSEAFLGGQLASFILWSDFYKFSYNKDKSIIAGKVGISLIPGVIINGKLHYKATMPFGRVIAVTTTTKHPEAAFWVASYMSTYASIDFTFDPRTGEDPFRYSHLNSPERLSKYLSDFSEGKVPVDDCKDYLDAVKASLQRGFPDLSIPGSREYIDILDLYIHRALLGEISIKKALDSVAEEWDKISESLGFESQKAIWLTQLKAWKELGYLDE